MLVGNIILDGFAAEQSYCTNYSGIPLDYYCRTFKKGVGERIGDDNKHGGSGCQAKRIGSCQYSDREVIESDRRGE